MPVQERLRSPGLPSGRRFGRRLELDHSLKPERA